MTSNPGFPKEEHSTNCTHENFTELFDKYAGCVYGLVLKFAGNDIVVAEKLTAETFIAVYRQYHLYQPINQSCFSFIYCNMLKTLKQHGYQPTGFSKGENN